MVNERPQKALTPARHDRRSLLRWLWTAEPRVQPLGLQYSAGVGGRRRSLSSMSASVSLHVALISLLIRVPYLVRLAGTSLTSTSSHSNQNVYVLRRLSLSEYFPVVRPPGPGGKPDLGDRSKLQPPVGNRAVDPRGLIVSAPRNPDNFRQTIVQPTSPPELRIPTDIKLPNVIAGSFPPPPQKEWKPEVTIPSQTVMKNLSASVTNSREVVNAPRLSLDMPRVAAPHLEVPLPSAPAVPQPSEKGEEGAGVQSSESVQAAVNLTDLGIQASVGGGKALLSLSVDPGPTAELVELPAGNRFGAFTIGAASGLGSPGGVAGGVPGGGSGGPGPGGDSSSGTGSGGSGGGGGVAGAENGALSVNGSGAGTSGTGALSPFSAVSLVYPVPAASRPRQSRMLVTSGPGGGGGLSVYGVLRGKKIYTIYLPMPGKNWILQYCESTNSSRRNDAEREGSRTIAVRLEAGLVPPSVEAQFDFRRPALPKDKSAEMIVLHGVISKEGSVTDLEVLNGLESLADEAALAAFTRWKFKPALHAGSAVAIEVLVGIPAI